MRVAITGTTGRLGAALARRLATCHEVIPLPRAECDLADSESLQLALSRLDCDVLLNPAGITSVEACEDDPRMAMRVNSAAPGKIALWAAEKGVRVIHFSTDYVFDGKLPGLRVEAESASPINAYGRSKLAGERAVLTHPGNLVLRVSWLFGPEKTSFVDRMIDMALAGEPLEAVADKWSIPTFTADLVEWVSDLLEKEVSGVLHACHSGDPVSWYDLTKLIVDELHACGALDECPTVRKQSLKEHGTLRAERPRHTAMSSERLAAVLGKPLRSWNDAVREYVRLRCE
jgi:dTDP-4-dehydrorhamnose reductase